MGGVTDSVGVVSEPLVQKPVAVHASAPARRRHFACLPWESTITQAVPWEARTYTFDWTDGTFSCLPAKWVIQRDDHNRVTGYSSSPESDANKQGFPELSCKQLRSVEDYCREKDVPFSVGLVASGAYNLDELPKAALDKIALARHVYASPKDKAGEVASDKVKVEAFWKAVKKQGPAV